MISDQQSASCKFCRIIRKETESYVVLEDDATLAFLDYRPLFPGHCLLVPKHHYETLVDFPADLIHTVFVNAQMLAEAVEEALHAEGSFVAMNNRVSQSVPHAHVHIVPRRKGDGLRGFFWPRQQYKDPAEMLRTQLAIRAAIERAKQESKIATETQRESWQKTKDAINVPCKPRDRCTGSS